MTSAPTSRRLIMLLAAGLLCALYLADLTGMGMVGPDEPRYADVGRAMAHTGDWITPRLWGRPWFEKPALLYWMTATGFRLGLGPDLAPRLPVALLSLFFLAFFWWRLQLEWGPGAAWYATGMLATSAGWLTYSHVAVTDLPMAAFFSAAILLSLPWVARAETRGITVAAACLGLAALAKGLVPLVLFVPVLAIGWRRWRDWLRPGPVLAFSLCALPWYILVTLRNGNEFIRVFFLEQHFGRFRTPALQHVQPVWFYVPILLVLLYPWFPLLAFPAVSSPAGMWKDPRVRTMVAVVLFGFVFFSVSVNKLPGYLLPLLPSAFALLGIGMAQVRRPGVAIVAPVLLLGALPLISGVAPRVLASHGLRSITIPFSQILLWLGVSAVVAVILAWFAPKQAFTAAVTLACLAFLWFQMSTFPRFDIAASARTVWRAEHPGCAPAASRDILYGLYYYSGGQISTCPVLDRGGIRVVR